MTTDAVTVVPVSSATKTSGRNEDVWGNRRIALYRVTLSSSAPAGGFTFDPKTYGFQGIPAAVFFTRHILVANVANARYDFFYDFVNKKIVPLDATDSYDDAAADDLSTVILDVLVVGE
jgi:hypothetical protein